MATLTARHIQDFASATKLEPHWGYADRVLPCTNDAGSCEYLDEVYGSHDRGMIYTAIIWGTFILILLLASVHRVIATRSKTSPSLFLRSVAASTRHSLLPECRVLRPVFGRTTRLQVTILGWLIAYLTLFTFIGMRYTHWVTPVKSSPGLYNWRSTLGPWSDRIGIMAYALTPLSVMLAARESMLSLATGLPYQSFNFLHRWLGYIIFAQSALHTIGWSIIEIKLYQPQPMVAQMWIVSEYMIWGVVAMGLLLILFVLSLPIAVKWTGYEFFRKSHYVLAMVYIGACWGHWKQLYCWLLASLIVWFADRLLRLGRTAYLHYGAKSGSGLFNSAQARITSFPDDVNGDIVRFDFAHPKGSWAIGQHFFLCFPRITIWQSHPFTPLSVPNKTGEGYTHSYIFRAKKGETKRLATTARHVPDTTHVPVILNGPYGSNILAGVSDSTNILCIAGGTGITYVLPTLLAIAQGDYPATSPDRKLSLIWAVRRAADVEWVAQELSVLREAVAAGKLDLTIHVSVTRDPEHVAEKGRDTSIAVQEKVGADSSSESDSATSSGRVATGSVPADAGRPDLEVTVREFVEGTVRGGTLVLASGPGGMISELRTVVGMCNDGGKVRRGVERADVQLTCDDRLEW